MKRFGTFLLVGSVFSTVEEFLTVVVLKGDVASYIFTLVILFPVFLTFVYWSSRWVDRFFSNEAARELAHYFAYGIAGLMIEWFLIGLSPWSNPNAHPLGMLVFQLGMFSFWAAVALVPRLYVSSDESSRRTSRSIMRFYVPYFGGVYLIAALTPTRMKFPVIIALILFGYLFLNLYYIRHFRGRVRDRVCVAIFEP